MLIKDTFTIQYPEYVSCHAVDNDKQEARLGDTAIQQAETASSQLQYNGTHRPLQIALLARRATRAAYGHMYNAVEGLAASSARTRKQRCSQVSNNEASVFHRQTLIRAKVLSPHAIVVDPGVDSRQRSLRIRSPSDVSRRFTMGCPRHAYCGHDMHAVVAMCITSPLVEPFLPVSFGHRQMHYSSKPAEQPVFPRGARLVTSPMRQDLAETKR